MTRDEWLASLTDLELRLLAEQALEDVDRTEGARREAALDELAAIRDEMTRRVG